MSDLMRTFRTYSQVLHLNISLRGLFTLNGQTPNLPEVKYFKATHPQGQSFQMWAYP